MELKRIKLRNIRSFESLELEFPKGAVLLAGDIGSGKSTILLAIEYALFGLQPGQKGSSLLRNNADYGEVSLEFVIDKNNVVVERRMRRSAKSITSEYSAITIDGILVESSTTEIKTKIMSLLGYPQGFVKKNNLLYRYTVFTPQEQMKQIIKEDPDIRLNVLRSIFGIQKYKTIRENIEIYATFLKESIKELQGESKSLDDDKAELVILQNQIIDLSAALEKAQSAYRFSREKRVSLEAVYKELELKIKERQKFEQEIEKTKILIVSKKENRNRIEREMQEVLQDISKLVEPFNEDDFNKIKKELSESKPNLENCRSELIQNQGQLAFMQKQHNDIIKRREKIFEIDFCPTCLQNVSEMHKHAISIETEKDLSELKLKISSLTAERDRLDFQKKDLEDKIVQLEKIMGKMEIMKSRQIFAEQAKKKSLELQNLKERTNADIELLLSHVENLKKSILQFSKYDNIIRKREEELNSAKSEERKAEITVAELKKEQELTTRQLTMLQDTIRKKEEIKKRALTTQEFLEWLNTKFTNLIDYTERTVMLRLRHEFSRLFSKWFSLLGGETLSVQLDETFTPIIIQGEIEMDYDFLSGGERTALALAYRLALNQTINSVFSQINTKDLVMLDEPTEGFSQTQIDKMRDIFNEVQANQIIIVSHEPQMEGFVDAIIRIKKLEDKSFVDAEVK